MDYARQLLAYHQPQLNLEDCQCLNLGKDSLLEVWVNQAGDFRLEPPPSDLHWSSAPVVYALATQLRSHIEHRLKDFYRQFDLLCAADEKLTQWMRVQRLVSAVVENRKQIVELDEVMIQMGELLKRKPSEDEAALFAHRGFLAHLHTEDINWPQFTPPPEEEGRDEDP